MGEAAQQAASMHWTQAEELVNEPGLWHRFHPCIYHGSRVQRRPGHCDQAEACLQGPHSCRTCPHCR